MGQIASAYPTAGGLYHWASILGGRGFGWSTAWFNMLGLIFVVSSVDVGLWQILFVPLIGQNFLGWDPSHFIPDTTKPFLDQIQTSAYWVQALAIAIILSSQALFNHIGIRATTILTDFSGYLIFIVAIILTVAHAGLCARHRHRPALHLHQQHRRCGRRRLAADQQRVDGLPARPCCCRPIR